MSALIASRGPDEQGEYCDGAAGISFATRRLSIIDLESGRQPMSNEDGTVWVVFNGEIFNARELRRELTAKGYRFASRHSDTEVLIHLYEDQQEAMVPRLNGMFAFVIYDRRRGRLFGARDRFGIKPLYHIQLPSFFAFASELKCLLVLPDVSRDLDLDSVFHYMSLKYLPGEGSIFCGIKRLRPGHTFDYDIVRKTLTTREYWRPTFHPDEGVTEAEWCERIREGLERAVHRWAWSDVPVGCSLSGGIDSSTIVGMLAQGGVSPIRTYSLGFTGAGETRWNELALARQVARRWSTEHHELTLTAEELLDDLVQMVWSLDEPYGGGLPSWYVFRLMGGDVKVALTGTGGDELFGNYGKFRWLEASPLSRWFHVGNRATTRQVDGHRQTRSLRSHPMQLRANPEKFERCYFDHFYYATDEMKRTLIFASWTDGVMDTASLLKQRYEEVSAPTIRDRVTYLDMTTQLTEEFLLMTDRFSMAHSVEARVPFLDHEFVELVFRIPAASRTRPRALKYLLKKSVRDLLPPDLLRAPKRGFVIPTGSWLRRPLRPLVESLLSPQRLSAQGLFRPSFYTTFVQPHLAGVADYADQVWTALMFQLWHLIFVEEHATACPSFTWRDLCAPCAKGRRAG